WGAGGGGGYGWAAGEAAGGRLDRASPRAGSGSGSLPDLSRIALSDAHGCAGSDTGSGPGSRIPSGGALDPFHLPDINADPWRGPGGGGSGGAGSAGGAARAGGGGPGGGGGGTARGGGGAGSIPPLVFHSCFESGNLRCAAQVGPREYDLFLAPDLNDRSEGGNLCQWFYFAVTVPPEVCSNSGGGGGGSQPPLAAPPASQQAVAAGSAAAGEHAPLPPAATAGSSTTHVGTGQGPGIKLNIVNLRKKESLFSGGKRPVMCLARPPSSVAPPPPLVGRPPTPPPLPLPAPSSQPLAAAAGGGGGVEAGGWFRAGTHIAYYPSPYRGRPTVAGEGAAARRGKKPSAAAAAASSSAAFAGGPAAAGGGGGPPPPAPAPSGGGKAGKGKGGKGKGAADDDGGVMAGIGPGLYCATFTINFPVPGTYYVASCYPYTHTDLQEHLDSLQRRLLSDCAAATAAALAAAFPAPPGAASALAPGLAASPPPPFFPPPLVRSLLCYTLSGLRTELLTITDWAAPLDAVRQRECIFITARVHPGETCASWIMQGLIEFLCSPDPAAATLRSSFVFKLVPMLNPDGVVNGSYRCSLAGVDLNRVWDRPTRCLYPTVFGAKRLLQQLAAAGRLALYIDIHGHSTKSDTFFYGCEPSAAAMASHGGSARDLRDARGAAAAAAAGRGGPDGVDPSSYDPGSAAAGGANGAAGPGMAQAGPGGPGGAAAAGPSGGTAAAAAAGGGGPSARVAARLRVRMLPYLTARLSSDYSFPKCSFKIRKAKLSAARVVVHRELGVAGSYTLESSLAGGSAGGGRHFGARDYLGMGHTLCRAICELAEVDDAALLDEMNARVTLPPL
ncbi:hypothetical protein HYH03_014783, partial [Edaphochlamys debaryana]